MPCDTPSQLSVLKSFLQSKFPNTSAAKDLDYSSLSGSYPQKIGPYAFSKRAVLERGQACLVALAQREEKVVAVVSHYGFLRTATSNSRFWNAEYRIFEVVDMGEESIKGDGASAGAADTWALDENGQLKGRWIMKEWEETEQKGGGMGWSGKGKMGVNDGDFPEDGIDGKELLGGELEAD
jgi:hypothetical protein